MKSTGGIHRANKMRGLQALSNKRCKNAKETALIISEIDRRKKDIEEVGGQTPGNDTLVGVLWAAMDANTRTHVSCTLDEETVYSELQS